MANEIRHPSFTTGRTLYSLVWNAVNQVWNGSAFVAYVDANRSTYAVAMTESGTSGVYFGTFPAVVAGLYYVEAFDLAGVSPAHTDRIVASTPGGITWSGTAVSAGGGSATVSPSDIQAGLTAQGYTTTRAPYLDNLNTASITASAPYVATSGTLTLVRGDDYKAVDGRAITISDTGNTWPNGCTAAWEVRVSDKAAAPFLSVPATISPSSGSGKVASLDLTAAQTASLSYRSYRAALVLTQPSGDARTVDFRTLTITSR